MRIKSVCILYFVHFYAMGLLICACMYPLTLICPYIIRSTLVLIYIYINGHNSDPFCYSYPTASTA